MLVQELKTIVPLHRVHGLKNNTVFSAATMLIPPDWDYVQYRMCGSKLRNNLNMTS